MSQHGSHWIWARPHGAKLAEPAAAADRGALTVEVARTFPLEQTGEAFDASRTAHTRGKLVIVP
ncbi:zinc-binding dehydrogenase [Kitasatospora atroaurantiaca]|uniref:zinc-binding dehydrogenase n=1 Tax=Kitasatospora atroaurantiaca TaxID=285545 RepID=UPI001FE3C705|nr:zinc-binding dehydrogenase [Kitasatospora atroaurantiaca]